MKERLTLSKVLDTVDKDQFISVYHNTEYTLKDMADILGITIGMVKNLAEYWKETWSKEEVSLRKKYNTTKYDHSKATQKRLETNFDRYGAYDPRSLLHPETYIYDSDKIAKQQAAYKETCNKLYNKDYYSQTNEFKENMPKKVRATVLEKYGVTHVMQIPEIKAKCTAHGGIYKLDNYTFHSSWELCLYKYAIDHNEDITCTIGISPIPYEYNGVLHHYYPDFIYKGDIIDIKGWQFLDEEYGLKNPYNTSENELYRAKYNCMVENNVKLFTQPDIQFAIDYIIKNYGHKWIEECKVNKDTK